MHTVMLMNINLHNKFKCPTSPISKKQGPQNFKMGHVTMTTPICVFCHLKANYSLSAYTFKDSSFSHYRNMKDDQNVKIRCFAVFGVFKVIGLVIIRHSAHTMYVLSAFHRNYASMLNHFRDIARYCRNSKICPAQVYLVYAVLG